MVRRGPRRFPRGIPRGLIEARMVGFTMYPPTSFPRGIPRGLIEAGVQRRYFELRFDVFRGVFPAASLKHRAWPTAGRAEGGVFRGVFPAASLKRPGVCLASSPLVSFPRGIPRGLIEAIRPRPRPYLLEPRFPRGIPRGLIEAARRLSGPRPCARFPRGIPRGLIEASRVQPPT